MREFVTLSITSFRGSGGEHYYGRLEVATKEEWVTRADSSTGWITRGGHGVERHPADGTSLERVLGGKEATYLNKKDQGGMIFRPSRLLKRGDTTTRFNDKETLEAAAIAAFPGLFDATDVLAIETEPFSDEHRLLAGPAEVLAAMEGVTGYMEQRDVLIEHGYLRK